MHEKEQNEKVTFCWFSILYATQTCGEKGGPMRTCAHAHVHNLPSTEALSPVIEEGVVNRHPPSGVVTP